MLAGNYLGGAYLSGAPTFYPVFASAYVGWLGVLNQLASTKNLGELAAANAAWASAPVITATSLLGLLAALNHKAGTTNLGVNAACNHIAGTTGLEALAALNHLAGNGAS